MRRIRGSLSSLVPVAAIALALFFAAWAFSLLSAVQRGSAAVESNTSLVSRLLAVESSLRDLDHGLDPSMLTADDAWRQLRQRADAAVAEVAPDAAAIGARYERLRSTVARLDEIRAAIVEDAAAGREVHGLVAEFRRERREAVEAVMVAVRMSRARLSALSANVGGFVSKLEVLVYSACLLAAAVAVLLLLHRRAAETRDRAETWLGETEARARTVAETASDSILTINESGRIVFANAASERLFGIPTEKLLGSPLASLMPERYRELHADGFRRYLATGQRRMRWGGVELAVLHADGREIPVEVSFGVTSQGGRRTFTGVLRDISERKRSEAELARHTRELGETREELARSRRLEAIGRLAGGVAHDFNNLLTLVIGQAELAIAEAPAVGSLRAKLAAIREAAERGSALTRKLLAFGRSGDLEPVLVDLNDLVRGFESMVRLVVGERVEVRIALTPGLPRIRVDPHGVEQVLLNLATNARDAMPSGGTLAIETRIVDSVGVGLSVRDTGEGMDAATRARIFEPFFTTKERGKGTGLGLATVYGIVSHSGGSIRVESEPGRGSAFLVVFPRADAEVDDAGESSVSLVETFEAPEEENRDPATPDGVRDSAPREGRLDSAPREAEAGL